MRFGRRFVSLLVCSVLLSYSATPLLAGAVAQRGSGTDGPQAIAATGIEVAVPSQAPASETNILIVKYRSGVPSRERAAALDEVQALSLPLDAGDPRIELAVAPEGVDRQQVLSDLNANPDVEYAEYDRVMEPLAFLLPSDPDFADSDYLRLNSVDYYPYGRSWHLRKTGTVEAWGLAIDDDSYHPLQALPEAVQVAVIDTGVHLDHPDFDGRVKAGYDFFESYDGSTAQFVTDADVTPVPREQYSSSGHGTGVAGVLAAAANNGVGSVGTGFDVEVVAYKTAGPVYNLTGYADGTTLILGAAVQASIRHAADSGVKVINLSIGSPRFSQAEADAVAYAQSKGCIVVAATGNNNGALYYPAALPDVVSVGAVRASGGSATELGQMVRAESSNFGPEIDIVAPGYAVWAPTTPGYDYDGSGITYQPGYNWWFGTSLATPQVSAALALLWRAVPASPGSGVVDALLTHGTEDMGDPGFDVYTGHGLLDINSAYRGLTRPTPITSTPTTYESSVDVSWDASPNALRYEYRLNGEAPQSTTHPTATVAGLVVGQNTVEVRAVGAAQGSSKWASRTVPRQELVAPSVEISNLITTTGSVDVTVAAVLGALSYDARYTHLDGDDTPVNWSFGGGPLQLSTLGAGESTLEFRATNSTVQSAWTTFTIQSVGLGATTIEPVLVSVSQPLVDISWSEVPGAEWYEYRAGTGPAVATADATTSAQVTGLAMGANTVSVRARAEGTYGPWASTDVTYALPAPTPQPASSEVTTSTVSVSWSSVPGADSYEYRIGELAPSATAETSAQVTGLAHGQNTIGVRAVNEDGTGSWGTAVVTFVPPAAPAVSASSAVQEDSVSAYWSVDPRAVRYEYQLNDGDIQSTTDTEALVEGLAPGTNTVRVRAHDGVGPGDWGTAAVAFVAPTNLTLTAPTFRWDRSTRLTGTLTDWKGSPITGGEILLERSVNGGKSWPDVKVVTTTKAGNWGYTYDPTTSYERSQLIRVRFRGDSSYQPSRATGTLAATATLWKPRLSTASPKRNTPVTVTGYIAPRFSIGQRPVRAYFYKQRSDGSWKYIKYVNLTTSYYSATKTKLTARTSLPNSGTWRVRLRYDGAQTYRGYELARTYSSYLTFSVRR